MLLSLRTRALRLDLHGDGTPSTNYLKKKKGVFKETVHFKLTIFFHIFNLIKGDCNDVLWFVPNATIYNSMNLPQLQTAPESDIVHYDYIITLYTL